MNREIVLREWVRATTTLRAAQLLVRERYHDDAVSRAYYVILHAAKAALLVHDISSESHASVRRLFGKHLILSGGIEPEWSKYLGGSLDDRLAADYDIGTSFSSDEAERQCRSATEFVERIRRYLVESGFTDADLGGEGGNG